MVGLIGWIFCGNDSLRTHSNVDQMPLDYGQDCYVW